MAQDKHTGTGITQIIGGKDSQSAPLMSFTAITTHGEMATAFVNHIIKISQHMIPDRQMTIEDLITVCHTALEREVDGVRLLEGKFLRGRISEQLSRAKRYGEKFAMLAIQLQHGTSDSSYDAIIDVLRERLRQSDMVFTFKNRVLLILPHIDAPNTELLVTRVRNLVNTSFTTTPIKDVHQLCFPSREIKRSSQVLDWAEDQLR